MQLCLMSIVIDFIRLADVPSSIDLVSSSRMFAAKHNELTSSYSLVMLILIFMLAYANCVTSFPKGWKVIVGSAFLIVANSCSSLTSLMNMIMARICIVLKSMIFCLNFSGGVC